MAPSWVDLPRSWQLQDIRAGLNVLICAISSLATFFCVRCCWQAGRQRVKRSGRTTLRSLLTVNTVGEALDIARLLRSRIFHSRHTLVLAQCVLVVAFATTTLLSGPITRYSTRVHSRAHLQDTPVYPAMNNFDIIAFANDYWTNISRSLEYAKFPHDRLLDFLPDVDSKWTFVPSEWTQTWSLQCSTIPRTPIDLIGSGNCSDPTQSTTYQAFPQLNEVFNSTSLYDSDWHGIDWSGFWINNVDPVKDMLWFAYGSVVTDVDPGTDITYGMNVSMASVHFHDLYQNLTHPNECDWAAVPVGSASWTRADCQLSRKRLVPDEHLVPYPDSSDQDIIASALNQNFQARFMMESATNRTIKEIQPEDLVRFYQVYMISKDTQFRQSIMRPLTVIVDVPQLSVAFLTIALAVVVVSLCAATEWCFSFLVHRNARAVPQTKVDWLLQAINTEEPSSDGQALPKSLVKCSSRVHHNDHPNRPQISRNMSSVEKFESAVYTMELSEPEHRSWEHISKGRSWMPVWSPSDRRSSRSSKAASIQESTISSEVAPSIAFDIPEEGEELYPRKSWPI